MLVKKETVDQAKERDYPDSIVIEENINRKILHVCSHKSSGSERVPVSKGEREALLMYQGGGYDAIASDDQRFIKKLDAASIPFLTPAACILYLLNTGKIEKPQALTMLASLEPFVSQDEFNLTW